MDDTFTINLNRDSAWIIQKAVQPGVPLPDSIKEAPVYVWQSWARTLREKVNNSILRFEDEEETDEVEVDIGREEAWLLDQNLELDGPKGPSTDLMFQVFRGLWRLDNGGFDVTVEDIPEDPPKAWVADALSEHFGDDLTQQGVTG